MVDWDLLGLLGHGLEFVEENLGVKLPRDLGVELFDGCGDHQVFWLLE